MSSYPKWLYHPSMEAVVVPDEDARTELGTGWYESPADFPKMATKKTPDPDEEVPALVVEKPHKRK